MQKTLLLLIVYCFFSGPLLSQVTADVFDIARKGTVAEAEMIIKTNPNAFNVVNTEGNSPLILACYRGNNEVAKFLISKGANINSSSAMGTALMATVVKGNNEIAKLLVANKADIDAADANGTTALIYAVMFKNKELVELFLKNKADKSKVDKQGKTAFEYAVFSGKEDIINLLK